MRDVWVGNDRLTATICSQFQIYPGSVDANQRRSLHGFGEERFSGRIATWKGELTAQIP